MFRPHSDTSQAVRFSVDRLAAWAPGIESSADWAAWARGDLAPAGDALPPLRQMPAALRRHAGPIGRLACDVAYRALDGAEDVPIIFCSRYGEAERSVQLLTDLARTEPLSPTAFSLSVHNAALGLLSIARRDGANGIAIAAGEASAAHGVIEACGLLADGAPKVLVINAENVLPEVYRSFEDRERVPYAWAALLAPSDGAPISLSWAMSDEETSPASTVPPPAALEVLRFLLTADAELVHTAGSHRWRWSRGG